MQVSALEEADCERVFVEQGSGGKWQRVELQRMLDQLRAGGRHHRRESSTGCPGP